MRSVRKMALLTTAVILAAPTLASCNWDRADDSDRGAPPPPLNRDDGNGAPPSRMRIPEVTQSQGQPVAEVREELERLIRERCGGDLCLKLRVKVGDNDILSTCEFDRTDPPANTRVKRESVVVLLTGTLPCEPTAVPDQDDEEPGTGDDEATRPDNGETAGPQSSTGS